jgi:uncharacterized protein
VAKLPDEVLQAWENREGPIVLGTVNEAGEPNIVYLTCVSMYEQDRVVIADNYFDKTRKNILGGSGGTVLFITGEGKAYQLKGALEYHKEGEYFDFMKSWNPEKHPGHAALVVKIDQVYSGASKPC